MSGEDEGKNQSLDTLIEAAKVADWGQVVANGGPPCFHVEVDIPRFCLRAKHWPGHDGMHRFTTLAEAIEKARGHG